MIASGSPTSYANIFNALGNSLTLIIAATQTYPLSETNICMRVYPLELAAFLVTKKVSVKKNDFDPTIPEHAVVGYKIP